MLTKEEKRTIRKGYNITIYINEITNCETAKDIFNYAIRHKFNMYYIDPFNNMLVLRRKCKINRYYSANVYYVDNSPIITYKKGKKNKNGNS